MTTKIKPLGLVLIFNLWVWKILAFNFFLGLLVIGASIALYVSSKKGHFHKSFVVLFILLLFTQLQTTQKTSLTYLDNDEQRVQQMRLREYPPVYIQIAGKTLWLPVAHWFEGRKESIAFFRIQRNFSELIDPNLYFFSNHPRERVDIREFEKFPYVFLPFFLAGLVSLFKSRQRIFWVSLLFPVFLISLIGNKNPVGPFSLFPFFTVTITKGVAIFGRSIAALSKKKRKYTLIFVYTLGILILLQAISYARY